MLYFSHYQSEVLHVRCRHRPENRTLSLAADPLACIAIFFVPTLLILFMYGGASPFSPEALLFHPFYTAAGLVFGIGYGLIGKMKIGRFYEKSA